jgi:putative CocE/NonD family hydrolase
MGLDFPMRNNIFYPYVVQWLVLTAGRASQARLFADRPFWTSTYREWYHSGRSFRELDRMSGISLPQLQEWLDHPEPDDFWDQYNPSTEQYAQIQMPVLTITGYYDSDQPGALAHYAEHHRASSAAAARHYLVIGPWDHAGTAAPRAEVGGIAVGSAGLIDIARIHLEWYQWILRDGPKPKFLRNFVCYYVMEADEWRHADSLDAVTAEHKKYFLDSNGHAGDVFSGGSLRETHGQGPPDSYRYDPAVDWRIVADVEASADPCSLTDQSLVNALCGKQFVYHTEPFERDIEISGFFRLVVWLSIDRPDTDFYVSIYEIALDGGSVQLSTDVMRARYRDGLRTAKLVLTLQPLRYEFARFSFISRQVRRGRRLRLVIAPVGRLIQAGFIQRNHNAGGAVADETVADSRPVTVKLFHDEAHPSVLRVPIARES